VRASERLLPVGARTKTPLSRVPAGVDALSLIELRGIREYDPAEFTLTALAGTPLAEVAAALAVQGQSLPFDPPFVARGATLGGAVAAGISGSGRQRYGGVRDFLIGVALVGGDGVLIRGGGKVVKNAAGFDLPKLMVGSLGTLGVLVELTFKVFPRPRDFQTLRFDLDDFAPAHQLAVRLGAAPFELEALDLARLDPESDRGWQVLVRVAGAAESLEGRSRRLEGFAGRAALRLAGEDEAALWSSVREAAWVASDRWLVRVPIAPPEAAAFERALELARLAAADIGAVPRRYSAGCSVLWLAWPAHGPLAELEALLAPLRRVGQLVTGAATAALVGEPSGLGFYRRLKRALDPPERFPDLVERFAPRAVAAPVGA
jgi:glycolate oxidase FAD binding subunit